MKVNTFCSLNGSKDKLDLNERIFKTCNLVLNLTCYTSILLYTMTLLGVQTYRV